MRWLFTSGGQNIGASASVSVLPMNTQRWSPLGLAGWISLQSERLSRILSSTTIESINSLVLSFLYGSTLTSVCDYCKSHSFDYTDHCWQNDVSADKHCQLINNTKLLFGKSKNLTLKEVALTHFSPSICSVSMSHSSGIFDILLESQQHGTTCLMHIHP